MTTLRKHFSIGSVVAVALIAATAYNFGGPVVGSFARHMDNVQSAVGPTAAGQAAAREVAYKTLCPLWRDATWIEKQIKFRKWAWCKDYVDRL